MECHTPVSTVCRQENYKIVNSILTTKGAKKRGGGGGGGSGPPPPPPPAGPEQNTAGVREPKQTLGYFVLKRSL